VVAAGKLIINGSVLTSVTVNAGVLGGTGTMGAITVNSGATLAPGASTGVLHVAGDLTLALGANYLVELNGTGLGTHYDQTSVGGAVSLDGATLTLALGFAPVPGTLFTVIDNDGFDAISGIFAGLPEGATFTADAQSFTISYVGGTGNDVVVTAVVPEPATCVLLSLGGISLTAAARRRSRW
jgi:hypothetical protein